MTHHAKCLRCGRTLHGRQLKWCSRECSNEAFGLKYMSFQAPRIARRDGYRCMLCRWNIKRARQRAKNQGPEAYRRFLDRYGRDASIEVDHIRPRYKGGTNDRGNLRSLCVPCHRKVTAAQAAERARAKRRKTQTELEIP